jgi:hypothetical protein
MKLMSLWPDEASALREANVYSRHTFNIYPVEYSKGLDYPQPAPVESKPEVLLQITGRDDTFADFKNVTMWHSAEHACDAMTRILVDAEYDLCCCIQNIEDDDGVAYYLDENGDFRDEHCEDEESINLLIEKYLPHETIGFSMYPIEDIRVGADDQDPVKRKTPTPDSRGFCLRVHTASNKPSTKSYFPSMQEAKAEAVNLLLSEYDIFAVELPSARLWLEEAEPRVCVELMYTDADEPPKKCICFLPSRKEAFEEIAMILKSTKYGLTDAIYEYDVDGDGVYLDEDKYLDEDGDLLEEHYTEEAVRSIIKKFLPVIGFDFVITDVCPSPKKQRLC